MKRSKNGSKKATRILWAASIAAIKVPPNPAPDIPTNNLFRHAVIKFSADNEEQALKYAIDVAEHEWLPFEGWTNHSTSVTRIGVVR